MNKYFKDYSLYTKLSWYTNEHIQLLNFSYTLSQYLPSIYATIDIVLTPKEFLKFKKIDSLEISDRELEVWFIPELRIDYEKTSYFSGPYKLIALTYEINDIAKYFKALSSKEVETNKHITLHCVDKIFYKMTLTKKYKSFKNMLASDVVSKIILENGGVIKKIDDTDYKFTWLQAQMTDYKMIRSLLPYSKTADNKTCFTFFMLNNEAYFSYIGSGKKEPHVLTLDRQMQNGSISSNKDYKLLIEKFGLKNNLKISNYGFSNFKTYTPDPISTLAYEGSNNDFKQHSSDGAMYLMNTIEDEHLMKNYTTNLRHRIHTFSRTLTVNTIAIPDITPLDYLKIDHTIKDKTGPFENLFYVASVTYSYPGTSGNLNVLPSMKMYLLSETDSFSNITPEGAPI